MNNSSFIESSPLKKFHNKFPHLEQLTIKKFSSKSFCGTSFPLDDPFYSFQASHGEENFRRCTPLARGPHIMGGEQHVMHGFQNRELFDFISKNSLQTTNQFEINQQSNFQEMKSIYVNSTEEVTCVTVNNRNPKKIDIKNKTKKISPTKRERRGHTISNIIKGQWSPEEDRILVRFVEKFGVRKWSHIAQMMPGRIGKQCRERWHNHLRPDIKKGRWLEEEDKMLIDAHRQLGNKWSEIAKILPGRSENTIKNHWNATKRKQLASRKSNKNANNNNPLQNYIKSLISTSSDGVNIQENSSAAGSISQVDHDTMNSSKLPLGERRCSNPNDQLVPTHYNGGAKQSCAGTTTFAKGDGMQSMLKQSFAGTTTFAKGDGMQSTLKQSCAGTTTFAKGDGMQSTLKQSFAGTTTFAKGHGMQSTLKQSFAGTTTFAKGDGMQSMLKDAPYNLAAPSRRNMEIGKPSSLESQMQFDAKKEMDFLELLSQGYI